MNTRKNLIRNGLRIGLVAFFVGVLSSGALAADRRGVAIATGSGFSGSHAHTGFHGFRGRGFFVGDGFGSTEISIQQSQTTVGTEPSKPVNKGRYVPPRWVDGGSGVEILQPGYWTGPETETTR